MADKTTTKTTEKKRSGIMDFFVRLVREKPMGLIGGIITVLLLLTGIFAGQLAPFDPNVIHGMNALQGPSFQFWFGTDWLGRDVLSRVIYGARISLVVGLAATLIATVVEVVIGILSGYIGGKFDLIVQRFVDAVMCFPALIILMVIMSIITRNELNIIIVLGIQMGIGGSRVIRSAVIGIKENLYIQSAVAIGAPTKDVLRQHVLPNIMAPIIIEFSTRMPGSYSDRSEPEFPGIRDPASISELGGDAQRQCADLYVYLPLDGFVAGRCFKHRGLGRKYVWRFGKRFVRPEAQGWYRKIWIITEKPRKN